MIGCIYIHTSVLADCMDTFQSKISETVSEHDH